MQLFSSFTSRKSLEASSSGSSIRQSYVEPSASSMRDADTKSCLWPCDEFMIGAGINEEFDQYIHNTELAPFIADKCTQHYDLTHSFTKKFECHSCTSRVLFHLYDRAYGMSLEYFCSAC